MAGSLQFKDELAEYKCDANECVYFKLVRKPDDIDDDELWFQPAMSHQIFGQNEVIFGYKSMWITLYYSAANLSIFLYMTCDEELEPQKANGMRADDVIELIAKHLPRNYITNLGDFCKVLEEEQHFKPFGEMIFSYDAVIGDLTRRFEIYKTSIEAPGFRAYHERLQTFLLWYVDAASYIDVDDDRWSYYLIFEKYKSTNGCTMYATVGYQTVYRYYAWPDRVRPRISQVLILPPYQRQGHGAQLLSVFYRECVADKSVVDITVEDPSEEYQLLRDFVDAKSCLKLPSFGKDRLMQGFSPEMAQQANTECKMNKKQARRVYEILRLKYSYPDRLKDYKAFIKHRLDLPFKKTRREMMRLQRCLKPDVLAVADSLDEQQRNQYLEDASKNLMAQYQLTVERLAKEAM